MPDTLKNLLIYLVDDDDDLREEILETLGDSGFQVEGFADAPSLYKRLERQPCQILILDVGLPGESGFEILGRLGDLRQKMGVIMLTGHGGTQDQVLGLSLGADAYLVKPTDLEIIEASILSLARRLALLNLAPVQPPEVEGWECISNGWILQAPDGTELPLTPQERLFVQRLFEDPGNAVDRDSLLEALGINDLYGDYHRLDAMVSRLRKKALDRNLTLPLRALRGHGFIFDARGQE